MIRISSRVSIITKGNRIQFICNFSSKRGKIVAFQRLYLNSYIYLFILHESTSRYFHFLGLLFEEFHVRFLSVSKNCLFHYRIFGFRIIFKNIHRFLFYRFPKKRIKFTSSLHLLPPRICYCTQYPCKRPNRTYKWSSF